MWLCSRDTSKECKGEYKDCTVCTLNSIRTEIEQTEINGCIKDAECFMAGIKVALNIIDKYMEMR